MGMFRAITSYQGTLKNNAGKSKPYKRKFSTKTINDRQLSRQKICQKISVIKTKSFDWELLTFDDIKKIVHFGISIHVLS